MLVGVVLLVMLLRSVHLDQLAQAFSHVNPEFLLLALPFFLVNYLLKVPRWSLLYGSESPSWDTLFGAMNVGYAINTLLPARLGEVLRSYWVRDRSGVSMMRSLSTIALERVSDGVTLVIMLLLTAPTVAFPRRLLGSAVLVGAAFVVVLGVMIVLAFGATDDQHPLSRFLLRLEHGPMAPVARMLRQTIIGLQALRSWSSVLKLVVYTLIIWGANGVLVWLVLKAFHIDIPLTGGFLLTAVLNLGMAVPSTPGYVGVFEYLMVLTLSLYGVPHTNSVAAALGFHAIAFIPATIVGLIYIVRTGFETTAEMVRASAGTGEVNRQPL